MKPKETLDSKMIKVLSNWIHSLLKNMREGKEPVPMPIEELKAIFQQELKRQREEIVKEISKFTASGGYLSNKEFKRGYDARNEELIKNLDDILKTLEKEGK